MVKGFCLYLIAAAFFLSGCVSERAVPAGGIAPPVLREPLAKQLTEVTEKRVDPHSGPITLDRAIDEALAASPELGQIKQRIAAATEQVRQAESPFYPRVVLSEEFNTTNNPVFGLMHIINQRRLQPNVDFNDPGQQQNFGTRAQGELVLFEGGSRWYDRKASLSQRRSVEAELLAARNQLVAKVTETYYRWMQAIDFTALAERALESAKKSETLGEARMRAEMALPSEVMRLKARSAEANGNLVSSRAAARRLQAGLERLVARPLTPEETPETSPRIPFSEPGKQREDPRALVQQALEKRPEMQSVRSLIEASRSRVRAAKGGFLPRIGTSAQYQVDSEKFVDTADSWMVAVQATWPLFDGGLTLSKLREARAKLKEMEARGQQLALDIALEVNQAVLAVEEATEKIRVADERRNWAQKALEEIRHQYDQNTASVDTLLQTELAWNEAEVSYTAAIFEGKVAQALLKRALGDFADSVESN